MKASHFLLSIPPLVLASIHDSWLNITMMVTIEGAAPCIFLMNESASHSPKGLQMWPHSLVPRAHRVRGSYVLFSWSSTQDRGSLCHPSVDAPSIISPAHYSPTLPANSYLYKIPSKHSAEQTWSWEQWAIFWSTMGSKWRILSRGVTHLIDVKQKQTKPKFWITILPLSSLKKILTSLWANPSYPEVLIWWWNSC